MVGPAEPPTVRLGDRSLFADLRPRAYLSHAAISPLSSPVRATLDAFASSFATDGVAAFGSWLGRRERLRGALARLVGATDDEIALTSSTTFGVVAIATCLRWRAGDRVVTFRGEFPTNVTPWQRAGEHFDLTVERLPAPDPRDPRGCLEPLRAALRRGVRLVAVSSVQFQTGLRMPLVEIGELCRAHGAHLFVDAIQSCGVCPIDVVRANIDFLTCGSHKWLMGTEGNGFVYVARRVQDQLAPRLAGWLSHEDPVDFLFEGPGRLHDDRPLRSGPRVLEAGTCNAIGFAALETALGLISQLGVDAIHRHVQGYLDRLEAGLRERDFEIGRSDDPDARSGILSVRPPSRWSFGGIAPALLAKGVCASTPDGWLRFAPHWPNHTSEVEHVLLALDELLEHGV